jgi:hypothetical protein
MDAKYILFFLVHLKSQFYVLRREALTVPQQWLCFYQNLFRFFSFNVAGCIQSLHETYKIVANEIVKTLSG